MPTIRQPWMTIAGNALTAGAGLYSGIQKSQQAKDALSGMKMDELGKFIDPLTGDMSKVGQAFLENKMLSERDKIRHGYDMETTRLQGSFRGGGGSNAISNYLAKLQLGREFDAQKQQDKDLRTFRGGIDPITGQEFKSSDFESIYSGVYGDDGGARSTPPHVRDQILKNYLDPTRNPLPVRGKKLRENNNVFNPSTWGVADDEYEYR